jgi:ferric-dicitrate binding protein FerR (iron transport regulator)
MDYLLYEAEDFAADESYLRYYFRTHDADTAFWEDWISRHPERLDVITNADQLISLLALQLPDKEFQEEYSRMQAAIREEPGNLAGHLAAPDQEAPQVPPPHSPRMLYLGRWLMGAAAAVIIAVSLYFILPWSKHSRDAQLPISSAGEMLEKINTTDQPMNITLEDGSLVVLQPDSKLVFPAHFAADRREVYLEGGGFFKIGRNTQRPFYVYHDNLVTHVLGTSFTIRMDRQRQQVEVAVLTGKVEVYKRASARPSGADHDVNNGVILTPNQRAIYREEDQRFETSLVDQPRPVLPETIGTAAPAVDTIMAVFRTVPLNDVIRSFEKTYDIDIEVENENIRNCHFSGELSNMDLYKKLDVICQSLNMSYEVIGTRILIRGRGCN